MTALPQTQESTNILRQLAFYSGLLLIALMPCEKIVTFPDLGTLSRGMGVLVAAIWLCSVCAAGIRRPSAFHGLLLVFVMWNMASAIWSIEPERTLGRIAVYLRMFGLSLIVWDLYRTRAAIHCALQAYVIGAWVPAASTIRNYLAGHETEYGRYSAAGDNMNTTAIVLALALPPAVYLATTATDWKWSRLLRLINFAYIAAGLFAIGLTGTRFAMVMSVPTVCFAVVAISSRFRGVGRWTLASGVIASIVAVAFALPKSSFDRLASTDEAIASASLTGRLTFWTLGYDIWQEHPWVGVGSATFHTAITPFLGRPRSAHNSFIAILVELGIVGLALALAIIALVAFYAVRQPKSYALFWLTVLAVWGLGNLPLTFFHTKSTWFLLSLLVASAYAVRDGSSTETLLQRSHHADD